MNNLFQIFLCDPEYLEYNLTERAEVFEKSRSHFVQDYSNFNYKIYFNEELEQEILDFDTELYQVYCNIVPYAYRADIGRYVLLYRYGGWYFDLNTKPNFYLQPENDMVLWENKSNPHSGTLVENRIIYSSAKKKLLSDCLQAIIKNYKEINYGHNALFVTGPGLIKQCFDGLDDSEKNTIELYAYDYNTSEFRYKNQIFNIHKHRHGVKQTMGLNYLYLKGVNNYSSLYQTKNIYRYTIPKKTLKKKTVNSNSKIPRIIHQTFKTDRVTGEMTKSIRSWIEKNPDYEHRFYDDQDIRNYVKEFDCSDFKFTSQELLSVFDSIIPGAGRADIFRLCVIYQEGGVYSDIDSICRVPLSTFIPNDADSVLMINTWYKRQPQHVFAQWFLPYAPKNVIIQDTLNLVIRSVQTRSPVTSFGTNHGLLERYTGPAVYNHIIFNKFGFKINNLDYIAKLKEKGFELNLHNHQYKFYFRFYKDIKDSSAETVPASDETVKYVIFRAPMYQTDLKNLNMVNWINTKIFDI